MANLILYKDFYCINHTSDNESYTLITPFAISANTYISGDTTVIETLVVNNESVGKYYVTLNPTFYSFERVYELKWSVLYNSVAPIKILTTRFRVNLININTPLDVETSSGSEMQIEILNNQFETIIN